MKKLFTLTLIVIATLMFFTTARAAFFPDIIVTSPNGIWTDSRAYATLDTAIAAVGANDRTIKIVSPQTVTALTVPANVTLEFERNGSIANSGQLTINTRNIIAPNRQIFTGTGNIDFVAGSVVKSGWFSNIETAFALTTNDTLTLIISESANITSSYSPGNDVVLKWESPGNILTVNAGIEVGNLRNIEAGNYQIFAGDGDFDFLDGTELKLSWFARLRSAVTWVESEKVTLEVNRPSTVTYDNILPSNLSVKVSNGGSFIVNAGRNVDFGGSYKAGLYQTFSGAGTVSFGTGSVDTVYPQWWGAVGDGVTDDSDAINFALGTGRRVILVGGSDLKTYAITKTLLIPAHGSLFSDSMARVLATAGAYTGNYMILYNSTNAVTWVVAFAPHKGGGVNGVEIYGLDDLSLSGIFYAGSAEIKNILFKKMKTSITGSNEYNDCVKISHITAGDTNDPNNYQIYVGGAGDGLQINSCSINNHGKGIRLRGCYGGSISNTICNSELNFSYCDAFTVENLHMEGGGKVIIEYSNCIIDGACISSGPEGNYCPIQILYKSSSVALRDVSFVYRLGIVLTYFYDIEIDDYAHVTIDNCYKRIISIHNNATSGLFGVGILDNLGNPITDWNRLSYTLSAQSRIKRYGRFDKDISVRISDAVAEIVNPATLCTVSDDTWRAATNTYYYKCIVLSDPVRMIGLDDTYAEGSVACVNGSDGVAMNFILNNNTNSNIIARLYRGTASGSYDKYVDIHVVNTRALYDNGTHCCGFEWLARAAAGTDTILPTTQYILTNLRAEAWANAAPTAGTWKDGDIVWKINAVAGASPGWMCVTAGTPGTWKAIADLAA